MTMKLIKRINLKRAKYLFSSFMLWAFVTSIPLGVLGYYINPVITICVLFCWYSFYFLLFHFKIVDI